MLQIKQPPVTSDQRYTVCAPTAAQKCPTAR